MPNISDKKLPFLIGNKADADLRNSLYLAYPVLLSSLALYHLFMRVTQGSQICGPPDAC